MANFSFNDSTKKMSEVKADIIATAKTGDRVQLDGQELTVEIQGNTVWLLDEYRDEVISYQR
jgi:hypothetical protein